MLDFHHFLGVLAAYKSMTSDGPFSITLKNFADTGRFKTLFVPFSQEQLRMKAYMKTQVMILGSQRQVTYLSTYSCV